MTPQNKKRLEVLQDTVKYYTTNVKRRCVDKNNECSYSAKTLNKSSQGCAVGRLIPPKLRLEWDKKYPNKSISGIQCKETLPENLLELGINFLNDLQSLHDQPNNWDKEGLTQRGLDRVEQITKHIQAKNYK